jgi:glutathionyl-hydroquinone reductase
MVRDLEAGPGDGRKGPLRPPGLELSLRIADHANVSARLARLIAIPAFRGAFVLDPVRRGYYSIQALNPTRIVTLGPELGWAPRRG